MISKQTDEGALLIRAGVEYVEDLKQHECCESHRLCVSHVTRAFNEAIRQTGVQYPQRPSCHDEAYEKDTQPHATGNHACSTRARRLVHDARICRIQAERERWRAIGYEIDPKNR